ncbi:hypothetical protein G3480_12855 [Thiorhodococcus mannitoliphagus]|uniref:Uncharacterized protein n=1 Tax=Thiorhodococcus mannitoliphagus TaxID=329406 RepID=A0A6P1DYG3_9GAMM|nr:DUF6776 family protein [Thiorhodococcus mannitoliphagus]NEX21192.1 hypothetical protein [Thiorhodococcus mannitoliphagus]
MPDSFRRLSFRLLAAGAFTLAVAATFLIGFEFGGGGVTAAVSGVATPDSLRVHLLKERDTLRALLGESERQRVILERAAQIDAEARKVLQGELKQAQDARLELNRELTYLKRLVQKGGKGAIQVYDMRLSRGGGPREYLYSFTVTQLVPGFGRSTGSVSLALKGAREGASLSLGLTDLPSADPELLGMDFEHFQNFQGVIEIPEDFAPESIVVSIEPKSKLLLPTSVVFPWELSAD